MVNPPHRPPPEGEDAGGTETWTIATRVSLEYPAATRSGFSTAIVAGSRLLARYVMAPGIASCTTRCKSAACHVGATRSSMPVKKKRSGYVVFLTISPKGRRTLSPPVRPWAAAAPKTSSASASSWTLSRPAPPPRRSPRQPAPRVGRSAAPTPTLPRPRGRERSQVIESCEVSLEAEAGDDAFRRRGGDHPVPLRLAAKDIGDVDFDDRLAGAAHGIGKGQTVVRECAGIDDDGVAWLGFDPVDQLTLVIRLQEAKLHAELFGAGGEHDLEIGERFRPVHLGLPATKRAEVGAVEHQDLHSGRTSASAARTIDGSTRWP